MEDSDVRFIEVSIDKSDTCLVSWMYDDFDHAFDVTDLKRAKYLVERLVSQATSTVFTPDSRPLMDLGVDYSAASIADLRVSYGRELWSKAEQHGLNRGMKTEIDRYHNTNTIMSAHRRACHIGKVDLERHSFLMMLPKNVLRDHYQTRAGCLLELGLATSHSLLMTDRNDFLVALHHMETNGILLDHDGGLELVYPNFNPHHGKTGRIKTHGGFNCMNLSHGPARSAIVSRFRSSNGEQMGSIYSFDYNAIDYRCIVSSVMDEEFHRLYVGAEDFHARTAQLLMSRSERIDPRHRKIAKAGTYVSIYGGSTDTLAKKLEVSEDVASKLCQKMDRLFAPVHKLRRKLYQEYVQTGRVTLPSGRNVYVEPRAHEGQVMGIYAQSFSSLVFERALVRVDRFLQDGKFRSKTLFPVHDELNLDVCPEEEEAVILGVKNAMEKDPVSGMVFAVKCKKGKTYDEATTER